MCGWKRARKRGSNILDIKSRSEIGIYLEGSDVSRVGFLSRGIIAAWLKQAEKQPLLKQRFASSAINSAKTAAHDLTRDGGTKSTDDDFGGAE